MKKSSKIIVWTSAAVVVLATAGALLGVFIPQWLNNNKLNNLVANQVKPSEGNGNYLQYSLKNAVDSSEGRLQSIEQFVKESLKNEDVASNITDNVISNYLTELFRNFKSSDSYANRYKTWNEEIDKEWDELVKSYRTRHGNLWEFYFQTEILDQAGGNEDDWKRNKLFTNVNSAFDELMFQELHVSGLRNGSPIPVTTTPTANLQRYLFSSDFVGGTATAGQRNKIVFRPSTVDSTTSAYTNAIANFQEFVFNEYVNNTLPIVTSMVLFKHVAPQTDGVSSFYNVAKAKEIYDINNATDVVGTEASYTWQAFPASQSIVGNPDGSAVWNATDKYLNFVTNKDSFVLNDIGGAINIPVTNYTDDSATLYYIKAASVFESSYAQYSAAATYKFNTDVIGHTADTNIPTTTTFSSTPFVGTFGTEIMSNFMSTGAAKTGYFQLPQQVKDIINNSGTWTGNYNGITQITDTVNVTNSPFILTRDEAGVHVIGIDRYSAIKAASTEEGKLNELKNTILWRHILTEFGLGSTTGFSLDLQSELKTYYESNKNNLLYQYILKNENDLTAIDSNTYLFSSVYTNISGLQKLSESIYNDYLSAWISYKNYQSKLSHKSTVTQKILDLQTNYTSKTYGNSVIQNGVAGVLPYTRTTTANAAPSIYQKGVVNSTYGTYNSLDFYQTLTSSAIAYNEIEAQMMLANIETVLLVNLYDKLAEQSISYKKLTYPSAKYNQYLLLGINSDVKSNNAFMNDGDILNSAVSKWISSSKSKNIVIIEKLISDINYNTSQSGQTKVLDNNTFSLGDTYTINSNGTTTLKPAPVTMPTNGDVASITSYVNYHLQNAYETKKIVPTYLNELSKLMQDGWTVDGIRTIARNKYFSELLQNPEGEKALNTLKELAALKVVLDYNTETNTFDLTKFRDYLLDQTSNFKKAAFVWTTKEKVDLFATSYASAENGIKSQYDFKPYNVTKNAGVNGYAYQGANSISTYKNALTWKNTVTFNDTNDYFNVVKLGNKPTDPAFTGYLGMQFENETSTSLSSNIKSSLFSGSLNVYNGYDVATETGAPNINDIDIKGVLYNIGTRADFVKAIDEQIFNWSQVNSLANWLHNVFGISIADISRTDLTLAKEQLIQIVSKDAGDAILPEEVFQRNEKALLVNQEYSVVQPSAGRQPFYFASTAEETNAYYSTAVFTQFNQQDIIKLFDINGDGIIDSNDKGINWTVAANAGDQFLGASAEAFFAAAINWYADQTAVTSTAYQDVLDRQGKVYAYDRRLNDQFGEDLVTNYKKTPTIESE